MGPNLNAQISNLQFQIKSSKIWVLLQFGQIQVIPPPISSQKIQNLENGFWVLYLDDIYKNPFFGFSRYAPMCTKIEDQFGSLSFVVNFGRIIPPELEVHTSELGEFCLKILHEKFILDKTHVPDFPLEAFQNFELFLVPDQHSWYQIRTVGTRLEQLVPESCSQGFSTI